jgi:hypothetical protein
VSALGKNAYLRPIIAQDNSAPAKALATVL